MANGAFISNGAVQLPSMWPPAYVGVPSLYMASSTGFTLATWAFVNSPGPLWTLGTMGDAFQPSDWNSTNSPFFRMDVTQNSAKLSWANELGSVSTASCVAFGATGWVFFGASFVGNKWTIAVGRRTCIGTAGFSAGDRWWSPVALGGGSFTGAIVGSQAFGDTAFTGSMLSNLANGVCPTRVSDPAWSAGAEVQNVWASTTATRGCFNATTGAPAACTAASVSNGWPSVGGCGMNAVFTAGGDDQYPAITLDLGTPQLVTSVRYYAPMGPPQSASSFGVLVGLTAPPAAGQQLSLPFYYPGVMANTPCLVQDPSTPSALGRVNDFQCGAWGRYVTLQLLSSAAGDGVLGACQLQAFVDSTAAAPPAPPTPAATYGFAAASTVTHRYGALLSGNEVVDTVGSLNGAATGVSTQGDGLLFSGSEPCVQFESNPTTADGFSVVMSFEAPTVFSPNELTVLWEAASTRLFIQPNITGAQLGVSVGSAPAIWGASVSPGQSLTVGLTCDGTACAFA